MGLKADSLPVPTARNSEYKNVHDVELDNKVARFDKELMRVSTVNIWA